MAQHQVGVGDRIPQFTTKDHEGYKLSDEDIEGVPLVLFFYPKDETPGCTKEVCDFRDNMGELDKLRTLVLGVSPDPIDSHQAFIRKNNLSFTLLSDPAKSMCKHFGVLKDDGRIERTTFVVDREGIIKWVERPVELEGHAKRVIEAVKEHAPPEELEEMMTQMDSGYGDFLKKSIEKKPKKKKKKK